jgi:quinol monooxygenase YgiN
MATLLAHIRVHPGMEARFEEIGAELHRASHARDRGLVRYEYWRGAEPGTYYVLESFDDFLGFVEHQTSDHHEVATPGFRDVLADIRLEWVDPIQGSSPLVPTDGAELPADASELQVECYERFAPLLVQPWWLTLR